MTAIVGVLNKHGVALAADSAVTFGNTHKVVNTGNKIFALSKYQPVTVATYGRSDFMGVPWDIVLKLYRKQLKEKSFASLKEYALDLLAFIHNQGFFSDEATQHVFLQENIREFYNRISRQAENEKGFSGDNPAPFFEKRLKISLDANIKSDNVCPEFAAYKYEEFMQFAAKDIDAILRGQRILVSKDQRELFSQSYYSYLRVILYTNDASGLIFAGYGESEIYPSLYSMVVSIGFDGRLHYYWTESEKIDEHGTAASVIPFAQVDVAQTIIRGVNPSFYDVLSESFRNSINGFLVKISDIVRPINQEASKSIRALDVNAITSTFVNNTQKQFKEKYTDALLKTIIGLDKEDMSNMAESFVSLTSLVRRMSPGEETVGGPVDVVFVSKGDGLIWMKRKHYFDPSLNAHFFANYYRDDK